VLFDKTSLRGIKSPETFGFGNFILFFPASGMFWGWRKVMTLSTKQRKALRAKAHDLKPVIRVGQKGMSENLLLETSRALDCHELVKVHVAQDDRVARKQCMEELANRSGAELIGQIGKVCILYRQSNDA